MRTSDSITAIAAAIVSAQAVMPHVPKETMGQVGNQKRRYADLATVAETARPVLAKAKLGYIQGCSDGADSYVTVTTRLVHESGEWIESSLSMPTGNGSAQAVGSAISYARRYSLMAILGLVPDDDDGVAASTEPAPPRQQHSRPADGPTEAMTRMAMTLFNDVGAGERGDRLMVTSLILDRDIESWSSIPRVDASAVIDRLTDIKNGTYRLVPTGDGWELKETA